MLASLYETADPVAVEVMVVAPPGSGGRQVCDEFSLPLCLEVDDGESAGRVLNRAMGRAAGRHTLLADHDVIFRPGCLRRLVEFMDETPDVAIAGPCVLDAYGRREPSARRFPGIVRLAAMTAIGRALLPGRLARPLRAAAENRQAPTEVDWLTGGARILRREFTEEISLPEGHCGRELPEMRLCLVARKLGWHVFLVPDAEVVHLRPLRYHPEMGGSGAGGVIEALGFLARRWFGRP